MKNTWLRHILIIPFILSVGSNAARAAGEIPMSAGALHHALERLGSTLRVLYVAAHPDDENTRLLTYLANGRAIEAAYLSMTRGGGGQNLVGTEQADLLEVVRTQELLAARRIDGARQFFTRMIDFGFSKSAQETLGIWGHDDALADVVWVYRSFQPDVVIARFDEKPPNHGHHTASAILAREAVQAAADPQRFPEQLGQGIRPWQVKRLLHNFPTWREDPPPDDALPLDVGSYDPWLGESYGELAARSRSQHQSQGFGAAGERGPLIERFVPVLGEPAQRDIFEGIEPGWIRYGKTAEALSQALSRARTDYRPDAPEHAVPALLEAMRAIEALPDDPRTRDAREHIHTLIPRLLGIYSRATATTPSAVAGEALPVKLELIVRRPAKVRLTGIEGPGLRRTAESTLNAGEKNLSSLTLQIPKEVPHTTPRWLERTSQEGRHEITDLHLRALPEGPPAIALHLTLEIDGTRIPVTVPIEYAVVDRVLGERVEPVLITPPATVTAARDAVLSVSGRPTILALRVRAHQPDLSGEVGLELPAGWTASPSRIPVTLERAGLEAVVQFELTPRPDAKSGVARPVVVVKGQRFTLREDRIDHPHIPVQVVLRPAQVRLTPLPATLPEGRFGYVRGPGDSVAEDLRHIGLSVTELDDEVLRSGDLSEYRAIIIGIRAYNTRRSLASLHPRLMEYVEHGGTLIVQYNTSSRWDVLSIPIGPYPLTVGPERVTDENATMRFLLPDHAILNQPNHITSVDFEGWVQERGLYYAEERDPRYQAVLGAADPGEPERTGGLLVATYGKGRYVYTGLSFFRQLPAGVPGAYRLFLNLLAGP